jgi:gliding motility-associated-like protein
MMRYIYVCLLILLIHSASFATKWYVDEGSNAGDVFTTGSVAGSNANTGTNLSPFATVNFALTQAAPFDTIYVDTGIYNQQVIITKSIYVFGAGSANTIFDGANKTAAGGNGFTIDKNVVSDIRRLSIINYNYGISHNGSANTDTLYTYFRACNISENFSNGMRYLGATRLRKFLMDTCTMNNNNGTTISRAILVLGPENDSIKVLNSGFNGNPFVGVDFNTPPLNKTNKYVAIVNNTITGCAQPGLALNGFLSGVIDKNTITNCGFCAIEIKTCLGNGALSGPGSFVISKNNISRSFASFDRRDICGIGITNRDANIAGASGTLTTQGISVIENEISNYRILNIPVVGGTFTPSDITAWAAAPYNSQVPDTLFDAFGIVLEGSNHRLLNNKFINCEVGVLVQQIPAFSGTTAPISDFFDANRVYTATTTSISAQFSGFYGCGRNVRTVNLSTTIDASNSFFNNFTAINIAASLQELNGTTPLPFPVINSHFSAFSPLKPTGVIDFSPWVKNVTDPVAIGYQGDYTSLIVDHQSPNVGPRPYIQEGHDNTSGSPVLFVQIEPGAYLERNVVSKSIHYIGVNSPTVNVLQMNGVGDTLYVDSGFELKDSLYCLNGLINTANFSTILLKETCVSDLGTPTSFVNGPLNAERLSIGNFTLNLPIGKQTFGNRYAILNLNQTNTALTTYTAEYFSSGASIAAISPPIDAAWTPQSHWKILDGGAANFTNPKITLNYNTNDYPVSASHTLAKLRNVPTPLWDYIRDLTPVFIATSGTVNSSAAQNFKFIAMGEFAIAPVKECPELSFTVVANACLNDSIQPVNTSSIAATNTIVTYSWNFGDGSPIVNQNGNFFVPFPASNPAGPKHAYTAAGTYTIKLVATARTGCKDSVSVSITIFPLPTGSVTPNGTVSICPNTSITANGLTTSNYTWAAIPALSITATTTLGISSPGKYFIKLQDVNGCKATSDTLTVITIVCKDVLGVSKQVIQQNNLGGGVYEVTYRIKAKNYGTTPITNIQLNEPLAVVFPPPTTFTIMSLTVVNGNFTSNLAFNGSSNINLISAPSNTLASGDSSSVDLKIQITPNNQFTFKNLVTASATGSFGAVSDSSAAGDSPDPNGDGIPDEFGSTDIQLIADFIMPSGFSPDGDGVNDLLVIQGIEQFPNNEVQIFNRWGNLVYKKTSYTNSEAWNAASNTGFLLPGNKVPDGTYYYVVKLTPNDKPLTGYLTIKY